MQLKLGSKGWANSLFGKRRQLLSVERAQVGYKVPHRKDETLALSVELCYESRC